jgi:hypothetical protein
MPMSTRKRWPRLTKQMRNGRCTLEAAVKFTLGRRTATGREGAFTFLDGGHSRLKDEAPAHDSQARWSIERIDGAIRSNTPEATIAGGDNTRYRGER